jgi:hypothetical protein
MLKRILILGVAALALALMAPAVGGTHVAKAQTVPEQGDAPEAPDQGDAPEAPNDQGDAPEAPDQGDADDDGGDAEDGPCASGARASGESCPPPLRQPAQPAPGGTPSDRTEKHSSSGGSGSGGQEVGSRSNEIVSRPTQVVQATTPVSAGVDTGTIPQGGIQAGAGGTADDGSNAGLLGGGALILVLAASGLALRRRDGLAS